MAKGEQTNRFHVTFIFEQTPKPGDWRIEWGKRDVEAAVRMKFETETGGVIQRVAALVVRRMRPRRSE
jgi:hypothetical protein